MTVLQELPQTGHAMSDAILWALVSIVGLFHMLDRMGFIPNRREDDGGQWSKRVGRLHVKSLQSIIRHETGNMIQPILVKMTESSDKQAEALGDIRLVLAEIVTLQRQKGE